MCSVHEQTNFLLKVYPLAVLEFQNMSMCLSVSTLFLSSLKVLAGHKLHWMKRKVEGPS